MAIPLVVLLLIVALATLVVGALFLIALITAAANKEGRRRTGWRAFRFPR